MARQLTGYAGGLARKRFLLDLEQAENLLPGTSHLAAGAHLPGGRSARSR